MDNSKVIAELTRIRVETINLLKKLDATVASLYEQEAAPEAVPDKKATKAKAEKPAAATEKAKPEENKADDGGGSDIAFADVRGAWITAFEKDPTKAQQVLAGLNAVKLSALKPDQYGDFMKKLSEI